MGKISDIMLLKQPEQDALVIETLTDLQKLPLAIGRSLAKIDALFKKYNELPVDLPFVEYPSFECMSEKEIRIVSGFKSPTRLPGEGDIEPIRIPERTIVTCLHRGNYNELAALYKEMTEWIRANGYKASGTSVEYYYTDPDVPEEEHVTRVEMPLL